MIPTLTVRGRLALLAAGLLLLAGQGLTEDKPAPTGPATEKRFPPLVLPDGFRATLFACDPLIEYPSVIALGPRSRSLFVAIDYMTGLGTEIVRRDEVRLVEDTDGDGYADRATVFATGFNSIQGLTWHRGTLYVMHAPYLTALRDTKGTGKADERRDLLTGLGLPPEQDQIRLHNANGVTAGHDGWLYLSLGDRGCDVKRAEGDRLVLESGGILRCRLDGTDLHVFATGLRNIYDVALDEDLNVFVRDNENDGGEYKVRVCHSFHGADHGYPYLYTERPDEALPPLADLGLGSSAGGVCYLERQFPADYRGNLFFCEWGRAVVRYSPQRAGSSFAPLKEVDFAAGAARDPYGFKPTDLVVDRDGLLFISDWADGQRPRRSRGRIYLVRHGDKLPALAAERKEPPTREQLIAALDAESSFERLQAQEAIEQRGRDGAAAVAEAMKKKGLGVLGRLHAIWILARIDGAAAVEPLFALAKADPEPRVQAQAVRALADLTDPTLVRHRLAAGAGDPALAARLAELARERDDRVRLEVVIALGRLRWSGAPAWLRENLKKPDAALAHAAQGTLRRCGDWSTVLKLLDEAGNSPLRAIALRAVAAQHDPGIVDDLIERLRKETDASRRREYADLLARVHRKPAPWVYWGFRPGPRPANGIAWERTEAIEQALDRLLLDPDPTVRLFTVRRMLREKVPALTASLGRWLREERREEAVSAILTAFQDRPADEIRPHLEGVLQDRKQTPANRVQAAGLFIQGLDLEQEKRLLTLAEAVEDSPVLAELLRATGTRPKLPASPLLLRKLASESPEVRARAVEALAARQVGEAGEPISKLLADRDARVRGAAALAVGKLHLRSSAEALLKLAQDPEAEVRRSSLDALRRLKEPRAVPVAVAALNDTTTTLEALQCLSELGGPEQATAVSELARRQPSAEVLTASSRVLTSWLGRAELPAAQRQELARCLAEIHGGTGVLVAWQVQGPMSAATAAEQAKTLTSGKAFQTGPEWRIVLAAGLDSRVRLGTAKDADHAWLGHAEIDVTEAAKVDCFCSSTGLATVWLNGKVIHERDKPGVMGPYPERFEAPLAKGRNQVVVRLTGVKGAAEFLLRFRRKSDAADRERFSLAALSRAGNPQRGREVFLNAEKSLCVKCHRVGDVGERIGPELTGLGSRFSKVHIVESVLEPSRTIAPSFETVSLALKNGKVVAGVKVAETETSLTLADSQAQKHVVARSDIEALARQPTSAMPDGLEKRLTEDEFVDLLSYLVSLKETGKR